jgi:hypothetical protein
MISLWPVLNHFLEHPSQERSWPCRVRAHNPWGLEALLDDQTVVTVDLRGTMPSGQVRVTLLLSDQR